MLHPDAAALVLSVGAGSAAGLVGCFASMRRMALAADALSHIALPGIGLALALRLNPIIGATAMLLVGALLVAGLESRTRLAIDTVVGVIFSAALALGTLMTSGEDLIEALLGELRGLTWIECGVGLLLSAGIIAFVLREKPKLLLAHISPEIARTAGIDVDALNRCFMLAFALAIALGLRYLGVLLMGALVIVPAATARRIARTLDEMLLGAVVVAVLSTTLGTTLAAFVQRPAGPLVVLVAASFFFLTLLRRTG